MLCHDDQQMLQLVLYIILQQSDLTCPVQLWINTLRDNPMLTKPEIKQSIPKQYRQF